MMPILKHKRSNSHFSQGGSRTHSIQKQPSSQPGSNRSQSLAPKGNNNQFNNGKKDWKGLKPTNPQREKSTPRLSDKEKAELLALGSCFNCKKPGHLSRNCPQGNIVKSNGNKPPGLTNYNIEFEPESSDSIKVLDSLELGKVEFWDIPKNHLFSYEPAWLEYNPEAPRRKDLGDGLALMAEYVLDIMQPYPGDSEFLHPGVQQHFEVFTHPHASFYQIYDCLTRKGCLIWAGYLKNPYFHLGEWYARWQARRYSLNEKPKCTWTMGDAYAHNAMCVLQSGISTLYPSSDLEINDEYRFTVVSKSTDQYFIHDEDFTEPLTVDKTFLQNPHIDLGDWYHAKCFPKSAGTLENDLNIDFSIFDRTWVFSVFKNDVFNEDKDLPALHPGNESDDESPGLQSGADLDSEDVDPPRLWPINEVESELEDNDDLPDLQSVLDSDEEVDYLSSDDISENELTDNPDDDTIINVSDTDTETDERPYRPIGDILSETIVWILDASVPYPHDSLFP